MTQNQIAYWNLQETKRSNVSREFETHRHNVADETETNRHNVRTENETSRHNLVGERETNRHNLASESFNISQLQEAYRHNVATERQGEIANILKHEANQINQAYNAAIASVRNRELSLAQEKEVQRILESQRDFNEAVRVNDAKMMVDAVKAGGDAVRAVYGNGGLLSTSTLAAGAVGGTAAYKASKMAPALLKSPTKGTGIASKAHMSTATKLAPAKDLTLFLVPNKSLEYFQNTLKGTERTGLKPTA